MDLCDQESGRCHAFCPRTPTDLETIRRNQYDPLDLTPELGAVKGLYLARAVSPDVRERAQHGGAVTALMALALDSGLIDSAIVSDGRPTGLPKGKSVTSAEELTRFSGSRFVVTPIVEEFNKAVKGETSSIGVTATPCQALALAKMRQKPFPENDSGIDKLKLVVGLFCGWALTFSGLSELIKRKGLTGSIKGLDIPPSKYHTMEVETEEGRVEISIDEVDPCVRESCRYCFDLTAEFSDISVGSARLPEGWEEARGWNQIIVRSETGRKLLDMARDQGVLEFRDVPEGNLENLKKASMNKKLSAVQRLSRLSGSADDLIYLDAHDSVFCKLLEGQNEV